MVQIVRAAGCSGLSSEQKQSYCNQLESGNILLFENSPLEFAAEDAAFLRDVRQSASGHHKNIAYKPQLDKITGYSSESAAQAGRLHQVMRNYSHKAIAFARELLEPYASSWKLDFASFRPEEEEGRALPLKKRNDLVHVDAFPTRPTRGDLILRIFTNINPEQSRVWKTGDPFAVIAGQHALKAGLADFASGTGAVLRRGALHALSSIGLPVVSRSAYDEFMLHFHDHLKQDTAYQEHGQMYRFEFPPGATWLAFTDVVPHAVLSGRFAVEQTIIIARSSLVSPANAPIAILEKLCGLPLGSS